MPGDCYFNSIPDPLPARTIRGKTFLTHYIELAAAMKTPAGKLEEGVAHLVQQGAHNIANIPTFPKLRSGNTYLHRVSTYTTLFRTPSTSYFARSFIQSINPFNPADIFQHSQEQEVIENIKYLLEIKFD